MSFGWSAGDIASAVRLGWVIFEALKSSGGSVDKRNKAQAFLQTYQLAISLVQECFADKGTDPAGNVVIDDQHLGPALKTLNDLYKKLESLLKNYSRLERKKDNEDPLDWIRRQVQKLQWTFFAQDDVQDIRAAIIAQITVIQPILMLRQSQKASDQSALQHSENSMNFEILKDMIRSLSRQSATQHDQLLPMMGPDEGVATIPDPPAFPDYEEARTRISPYVPRTMTDETSATLKKLRGNYKLIKTLRGWLLDSDENEKNCLWLRNASAVQLSAIMYDVGSSLHIPVLAYSCRQVDENGVDIPVETLFTQMLYAFLDALLGYLQNTPDARQRIDASGFAALNGTFASAEQAITLLGNLLDNVPMACVCIIDNFQRLDDDDTPQVRALLKDFLGLFKQEPGRAYAFFKGRHKLLVTSPGLTGLLVDMSGDDDGDAVMDRLETDKQVGVKEKYKVWEELKTGADATKN